MDEGMTFGPWLKMARARAGVSQERLSEIAAIDRAHLSKMENDRIDLPRYETRQRIHAALGTTEDELIALVIVAGPSRPSAVRRVLNEFGPSRSDADRFIASLTPEQRALLRRLLDEGDAPRPGDENPAAEARRLRDAG